MCRCCEVYVYLFVSCKIWSIRRFNFGLHLNCNKTPRYASTNPGPVLVNRDARRIPHFLFTKIGPRGGDVTWTKIFSLCFLNNKFMFDNILLVAIIIGTCALFT